MTDIANLHERTEGWITGIYLATLSLQRHSDPAAFIASFNGSNPALAEYLAEDVLARQTGQCQQFLLQTSVLAQFCPALCDAVTGRNDSQSMIESLERANLFVIATDDQRQWFRYHPLFADFLVQTLKQRHPDSSSSCIETPRAGTSPMSGRSMPLNICSPPTPSTKRRRNWYCMSTTLVENGHASLLMRWLSRIPAEDS